MNPQQTQDLGGLNPDQITAALSFATHQGEQHLPQPDMLDLSMQTQGDPNADTAPQEPQDAPTAEQPPEPTPTAQEPEAQQEDPNKAIVDLKNDMEGRFDELKKLIEGKESDELKQVKSLLEDATKD